MPAEAVEGPWNGRWLPLAGAWGLKDLLKGIVDGLRADPNGEPFLEPVDHVGLGLTDYLEYVLLRNPVARAHTACKEPLTVSSLLLAASIGW